MSLTAAEQYLLELINRARLDPAAEAARYGVDLNDGLEPGQIGTDSLSPLAPSDTLSAAAAGHSQWMLDTGIFSHTGVDNSNAGERVQAAGYTFSGTWSWRENLAWVGSTGAVDLESAIEQHHKGLYLSPHHRENRFATDVSEIGIGQVAGTFSQNGTAYNSSMLTVNYAKTGTDVFVTGVAYDDRNGNDFYSVGEGREGVMLSGNGASDTTQAAGGYAVRMSAQADVTMTVVEDGKTLGHVVIDTSGGNVKLDVLTDDSGALAVHVSSSATLVDGIDAASLLGTADLDLAGNDARNVLYGNGGDNAMSGGRGRDRIWGAEGDDHLTGNGGGDRIWGGDGADLMKGHSGRDRLFGGDDDDRLMGGNGRDRLFGGDGDDTLIGGQHRDVLRGNDGSDVLNGGAGPDVLRGGAGEDTFIYTQGRDRIRDFQDNADTIIIDRQLAGTHTIAEILDMATVDRGNTVLDFGQGDMLIVHDVTDPSILANDLLII